MSFKARVTAAERGSVDIVVYKGGMDPQHKVGEHNIVTGSMTPVAVQERIASILRDYHDRDELHSIAQDWVNSGKVFEMKPGEPPPVAEAVTDLGAPFDEDLDDESSDDLLGDEIDLTAPLDDPEVL